MQKVMNLGHDCSSTMICQHLLEYNGHGPFDWVLSTPISLCKFLSYLFIHGVDKTVELFAEIKPLSEIVPHWLTELEFNVVHWDKIGMDKIRRRIQRFYDTITDKNIFIIFTYINHDQNELLPNETVPPNLIKVSKMLSLFRPQNTFKIAFLHAEAFPCDTTGFEEASIDRIEVPHVSATRYWIWPCVQRLKNKYNLTEIDNGMFRPM